MATRDSESIDWDLHRRKLFIQHLSPTTTSDTLKEYFSDFEMEACIVPLKEGKKNNPNEYLSFILITVHEGNNQSYGFIIFRKESSVDTVMSRRPHTIDGQTVDICRSVPDQGALIEKLGVTELIISNLKCGTINENDLRRNLGGFGEIVSNIMDSTGDSCTMEFKE